MYLFMYMYACDFVHIALSINNTIVVQFKHQQPAVDPPLGEEKGISFRLYQGFYLVVIWPKLLKATIKHIPSFLPSAIA